MPHRPECRTLRPRIRRTRFLQL